MQKFQKYFFRILPYILIAVILFFYLKSCENNNITTNLYEATQDTLTTTRNKYGQQENKIGILEATNENQFLNIKTNDSTIIHLQNQVKKYKGKLQSATFTSTETLDTGTTIVVITSADTIIGKDSLVYIYPKYETEWDEKWSKGEIIARRSGIFRKILTKNEYEFTQGLEKRTKGIKGIFKKREPVVTMTNLNPNTVTKELRTFTVKTPKKRFSFGLQGGYGMMLNDNGINTGIYGGIGFEFTIIRF